MLWGGWGERKRERAGLDGKGTERRDRGSRLFPLPIVPRAVLLGILGGGVPPGSSNPDPISDQKNVIFSHSFSD